MLNQDRQAPSRDGLVMPFPVKAGVTIHAGALVVLDGGYAKPGAKADGLVFVGRAQRRADNAGGADGAVKVVVQRKRVFRWKNSAGGGKVAQADVGGAAYIADDETVTKTAAGASKAGTVLAVDDDGVWVE